MMLYETTANLNVRERPGLDGEILDQLPVGSVIQEVLIPVTWAAIEMDDGSLGFVSRKFLKESVEAPAAATPVGVPAWIVMAKKYLGTKEYPGSADNPTIIGWDKLMKSLPGSMDHDATPWCAIFVHAMFHLAGIDPKVESAAAVDWMKFGVPTTFPKIGDVVVFKWSDGSHHVAFVMSVAGGLVHVIGGNQSDAVTLASYSTSNVMGYRRYQLAA